MKKKILNKQLRNIVRTDLKNVGIFKTIFCYLVYIFNQNNGDSDTIFVPLSTKYLHLFVISELFKINLV